MTALASYEKRNPFCPDEVTGTYPSVGAGDACAAVAAARAAFADWSRLPLARRAGYLTAAAILESRLEALARANGVEFGLSAAIFTTSLPAALRFRREAQAGILHVNSQTAGAEVHVPFGGIRGSGFGPHEQGQAAADFYTDTITVYVEA